MPLETPTVPGYDERSEQVFKATNDLYETGQVDQHFAAWEQGLTPEPPQLDLERDDSMNPNYWSADNTPSTVEAPVEARPALTRGQEITMLYHGCDDLQLHQGFDTLTKGIGEMQRARLRD